MSRSEGANGALEHRLIFPFDLWCWFVLRARHQRSYFHDLWVNLWLALGSVSPMILKNSTCESSKLKRMCQMPGNGSTYARSVDLCTMCTYDSSFPVSRELMSLLSTSV